MHRHFRDLGAFRWLQGGPLITGRITVVLVQIRTGQLRRPAPYLGRCLDLSGHTWRNHSSPKGPTFRMPEGSERGDCPSTSPTWTQRLFRRQTGQQDSRLRLQVQLRGAVFFVFGPLSTHCLTYLR